MGNTLFREVDISGFEGVFIFCDRMCEHDTLWTAEELAVCGATSPGWAAIVRFAGRYMLAGSASAEHSIPHVAVLQEGSRSVLRADRHRL